MGLSLKRWLTCESLWEVCGRRRVRDERCRQEILEPLRARRRPTSGSKSLAATEKVGREKMRRSVIIATGGKHCYMH